MTAMDDRIHEALKSYAAAARAAEVSDEQVRRVMLESPRHGGQRDLAGTPQREMSSARHRRRTASRRPPRVVAVGLACLAFAGTALAASGIWDPEFGGDSPRGPIDTAPAPIPSEMKRALGVLRRQPNARDRSPAVEAILRKLLVSPADGVHGIRPDSVRYLAPGFDGKPAVLLLAARANPHYGATGEPICVYRPIGLPSGEVPAFCHGLPEVLSGHAWSLGFHLDSRTVSVEGLVPDGVAGVTVRLVWPGVKDAKSGRTPPVKRSAPVANNYFYLSAPLQGAEYWRLRAQAIWRDSRGKVIRVAPFPR